MENEQLPRIQVISDLIRRAKQASQENVEVANGVAISLLHDAIEHSLYFCLLDSDNAAKPREEFKQLLGDVAKIYQERTNDVLPFQRKLILLNTQRVAFKHHGTRPTRTAMQEGLAYGIEFITAIFEKLYHFNIEEFHQSEFLRIDELRRLLAAARQEMTEGNFDEAMCQLSTANYRIDEAFAAVFGHPRPPLRLSSPFNSDSGSREMIEFITRGDTHTLITAVLIASGQDVAAYTGMRMRLPVIYAMADGSFRFDRIVPNPYTAEDVQNCIDQITRVAAFLEERFPALRYEQDRWLTGVISPWPN